MKKLYEETNNYEIVFSMYNQGMRGKYHINQYAKIITNKKYILKNGKIIYEGN
jgi:hypothetical protein